MLGVILVVRLQRPNSAQNQPLAAGTETSHSRVANDNGRPVDTLRKHVELMIPSLTIPNGKRPAYPPVISC
jgi:hypothetical protein